MGQLRLEVRYLGKPYPVEPALDERFLDVVSKILPKGALDGQCAILTSTGEPVNNPDRTVREIVEEYADSIFDISPQDTEAIVCESKTRRIFITGEIWYI